MLYPVSLLKVTDLVPIYKALGDRTRLKIVAVLTHGELTVNEIADALNIKQPNASRQLAILKAAGIIEVRRAGTFSCYTLATEWGTSKSYLDPLIKRFKGESSLASAVKSLADKKSPARSR